MHIMHHIRHNNMLAQETSSRDSRLADNDYMTTMLGLRQRQEMTETTASAGLRTHAARPYQRQIHIGLAQSPKRKL